ncbi:hypothetical protein ACYSNU_18680 [Enterococcus sp. LJL120]
MPGTNYTVKNPYHFEKDRVFGNLNHIKNYDFLFIDNGQKRDVLGFFDDMFTHRDNYSHSGIDISMNTSPEKIVIHFLDGELSFVNQSKKSQKMQQKTDFHLEM